MNHKSVLKLFAIIFALCVDTEFWDLVQPVWFLKLNRHSIQSIFSQILIHSVKCSKSNIPSDFFIIGMYSCLSLIWIARGRISVRIRERFQLWKVSLIRISRGGGRELKFELEIGIKKQRVLFFFLFFFLLKCLQNLEKIFQYTWETYSRTSYFCQNSKNFEKINQNLKERSIVIMASLLVRNVEKSEFTERKL